MNVAHSPSHLFKYAFNEQQILNSSVLTEVRDSVSDRIVPHNLHLLEPGQRIESSVSSIDMGKQAIIYIKYGADVLIDPGTIQDYYIITIPISGTIRIATGESEPDIVPGYFSVSPTTRPVKYLQNADCSIISFKVYRPSLERCLKNLIGSTIREPVEFQLTTKIDGSETTGLLRLLAHLCDVFKPNHAGMNRAIISESAEQYALTTLLATISNNYSDYLHDAGLHSEAIPHYVTQAQEYILNHLHHPIHLDELVEATGMSARSLFAAFKKYKGTSPITYARLKRLDKVHMELLEKNPQMTTVTEVATKWGFYNLGSFSAQYAKEFGEKPSNTLRRGHIQ